MPELLIRPGPNDHEVIKDLLAPGGAAVLLPGARPLIDRLVVDAHVANARPEFAEAANMAGVPLLVDPLTPFWQGQLRDKDKWALLPFGHSARLGPRDWSNDQQRDSFVAKVVDFQAEAGATAIIPPYLYVTGPADPNFDATLGFLRATSRYLKRAGIALPVMPVLCAQLKGFGSRRAWEDGLDRFANAAIDLGPESIAICLSPTGGGSDSYNKVLALFDATLRLKATGARVLVWRQGIYGPGLVAAGADGYETGIGTRELSNIAGAISSRRPPAPGKKRGGGGVPGIYLEPLHRSVPSRVGEILLGDRGMRPKVMCDDERCCPNGAASTLDQRRHHAVRTRARELAALESQPAQWRLHLIAREARAAADIAIQANQVLKAAKVKERIGVDNYNSLASVAEYLGGRAAESEAA